MKYKIEELDLIDSKYTYLKKDENDREIFIFELDNVVVLGKSLFYPNTLLYCNNKIYNPIRENIMSLKNLKNDDTYQLDNNLEINNIIDTPVFFFIYNVDNYYHFVYDTLPYLISFKEIKKENKDLKLLMNFSYGKSYLYRFVKEFLELLNISDDDIIIVDKNTEYKKVFISSSYTHENDSNKPPRKEIFDLYNSLYKNIKIEKKLPKKIYISRRTWLNNDTSNIGTNYTTRRRLVNEDELVNYLQDNGYEEVFTENYNTIEKINLFRNCDVVIGSIGGGLCNVLFSDKNTKLISLCSPGFLDVNERFKYSFSNVETTYFDKTSHCEIDEFKTNMRVKYKDIIGEISDIDGSMLTIIYTGTPVAGWNNDGEYKSIVVRKEDCLILDNGLNSPWLVDITELKKIII
jgi:capsular polysaccharide biosynthesis protein